MAKLTKSASTSHRYRTRNNPNPPPAPKTYLENFPPEVREMIFKESLVMDVAYLPPSRGHRRAFRTTPSLLIALRGNPMLYAEALKVYYKINTCVITPRNFGAIGDLSRNALDLVKNLRLDLVPDFSRQEFDRDSSTYQKILHEQTKRLMDIAKTIRSVDDPTTTDRSHLRLSTNIQTFEIQLMSTYRPIAAHLIYKAMELKKLKEVVLHWVSTKVYEAEFSGTGNNAYTRLEAATNETNKKLGPTAQVKVGQPRLGSDMFLERQFTHMGQWKFVAVSGKDLTFSVEDIEVLREEFSEDV